jgi:hypothetical protein
MGEVDCRAFAQTRVTRGMRLLRIDMRMVILSEAKDL